ncbi:MAG: polyisoprenoid-binding protein [Xanthomonadaceae bacterium]|nr:polyisoprenoid-binding protein [Xanthomonadaceae bacterium]
MAAQPLQATTAQPLQATTAQPLRYVFDPVHTRVMFSIDHAGFSRAIGTVSGARGQLLFDLDNWQGTRMDVTVPMRQLDMGDADWTTSVLAPRFLDTRHYPEARWVVEQLTREDDNHGRACGTLTLHGVTRPLCMALTLNRAARHPLPPFRKTLGFSASTTLKRSDFGMTHWQSLVGDLVELRIEAELYRQDAGRADNEPNRDDDVTPASPAATHPPEPKTP